MAHIHWSNVSEEYSKDFANIKASIAHCNPYWKVKVSYASVTHHSLCGYTPLINYPGSTEITWHSFFAAVF